MYWVIVCFKVILLKKVFTIVSRYTCINEVQIKRGTSGEIYDYTRYLMYEKNYSEFKVVGPFKSIELARQARDEYESDKNV